MKYYKNGINRFLIFNSTIFQRFSSIDVNFNFLLKLKEIYPAFTLCAMSIKRTVSKKNVRKANASVILGGDQIFFSISLVSTPKNQNL